MKLGILRPQDVFNVNRELIEIKNLEFSSMKNLKVIDLKEDIIPTNSFITNKTNIPDLMYERLKKRSYTCSIESFLTGSQLSLNKKQFYFKNKYKNAIISDAVDMVPSMIGTAIHAHMEEIEKPGDIVEVRYSIDVLGKTLSAQLDHYRGGVLSDYKVVKAWNKQHRLEMLNEGILNHDPYVLQANFNAYLLRKNGHPVNKARLIFLYKDYDPYVFKSGYPESISEEEEIELWEDQIILDKLEEIVKDLSNIDESTIQQYLCSPEERWNSDTCYCLKKVGSSRALPKTIFKTFEEAESALINRLSFKKGEKAAGEEWYKLNDKQKLERVQDFEGKLYIETRKGINKKCERFCPGRDFCSQYQEGFLGNELFPFIVSHNGKEKEIEIYGSDYKEAYEKIKMIHSNLNCGIIYNNKVNNTFSFLGDL
jgi:hypothetical protein